MGSEEKKAEKAAFEAIARCDSDGLEACVRYAFACLAERSDGRKFHERLDEMLSELMDSH